jgi:hypothetical protein
MRKGFLAACMAVLLTGAAAFYGGRAWERDEVTAAVFSMFKVESARQDAVAFEVSRSAVKKLREGRPREAELELVRFARLMSAGIELCMEDETCRSSNTSQLPTATEIAEVKSWYEARTPQKPVR